MQLVLGVPGLLRGLSLVNVLGGESQGHVRPKTQALHTAVRSVIEIGHKYPIQVHPHEARRVVGNNLDAYVRAEQSIDILSPLHPA
jgi:hypothetical protein